jgi:hypothetical protein
MSLLSKFLEKRPFNSRIAFYRNKKRCFNIKKYNLYNIDIFLDFYFSFIFEFICFFNNFLKATFFNFKKTKKKFENSYQLVSRNFKFTYSIPFQLFNFFNKKKIKWSLEDRWEWLEKKKKKDWGDIEISVDSLKVFYKGLGKNDEDAAAIRSNFHIPKTQYIFYFETKIINAGRSGFIGIGFCSKKVDLDRLPGWEKDSLGYHGDDGNIFKDSGIGMSYGPNFTTGDTIGLCWNLFKKNIFFTKNGTALKTAFFRYCPFNNRQMFPVVGLRTPGESVEVNFSRFKFEFDINSYISKETYFLIDKTIRLKTPITFQTSFIQKTKKLKLLIFSVIYFEKEKSLIFLEIFYYFTFKRQHKIFIDLILIISHELKKINITELNISNILKKKINYDYFLLIRLAITYVFRPTKTIRKDFNLNKSKFFYNLFLLLIMWNLILKNHNKYKVLNKNFLLNSNTSLNFKKMNNYKKELRNILLFIFFKGEFKSNNLYYNLLIKEIRKQEISKCNKIVIYNIKKIFRKIVIILKISKLYKFFFNLIKCSDIQIFFILNKIW